MTTRDLEHTARNRKAFEMYRRMVRSCEILDKPELVDYLARRFDREYGIGEWSAWCSLPHYW